MFCGGSYSSVYVPPPMFVFPVVLMACVPTFFPFILYSVFLFLSSHCPWFYFFPFGGVDAYVFHHMQLYVYFEICVLNIIYHI